MIILNVTVQLSIKVFCQLVLFSQEKKSFKYKPFSSSSLCICLTKLEIYYLFSFSDCSTTAMTSAKKKNCQFVRQSYINEK